MSSNNPPSPPLTKGRKSFSLRDALISPRKKPPSHPTLNLKSARNDHSGHHREHSSGGGSESPSSAREFNISDKEKQKSQKLHFLYKATKSISSNHTENNNKQLLSSGGASLEMEHNDDFKSDSSEMPNEADNGESSMTRSYTKTDYFEDTTMDETTIELPPLLNLEDLPENHQAVSIFQKYILRWNGEEEFLKRCRWQEERTYIVNEIMSTEENYVKGLTMLVTEIYDPVLNSLKSDEPLLEASLVKKLFPEGHIKIILSAHSGVIQDLKKRVSDWSPQQIIGDIFNDMCKFLRLYTKYAETFPEVEESLENLRKEKKFMHFLKEKWPDRGDTILCLRDLLITPVQRIPRYQLLLESLYKKTWSSHRDYSAIEKAFLEMKNTAQYVNDKAKEGDRNKKLIQIETSLIGLKKPLAAASRKFIKEGILHHRTEKGDWKKRYFFLFNDCMIRARLNRKQKGTYIFIEKVTLRQGQVYFILHPDIEDEIPEPDRDRYFEFTQPHPLRYVLCAPTVEEKREWCNAIQRALDEMNEAEREHQEIKKKISAQKAHMAKNLITVSLMQQARDRANGSPRSYTGGKSQTADLSNIRSYKEHLSSTKMTTQEKWEQTKQSEMDVQNWEKTQKRKEDEKKIEEALKQKFKKEEAKKELMEHLNNRSVKKYHLLIQEVKQNSARNINNSNEDN